MLVLAVTVSATASGADSGRTVAATSGHAHSGAPPALKEGSIPDKSLSEPPESIELMAIAEMFRERAANADAHELNKAMQDRDFDRVAQLLQFSPGEFRKLSRTIRANGQALRERFPNLVEQSALDLALSRYGFADFKNVSDAGGFGILAPPQRGNTIMDTGVSCRYAPFTAALIVCSAGGAVLYAACATVALCEYCSGGWVDAACGSN